MKMYWLIYLFNYKFLYFIIKTHKHIEYYKYKNKEKLFIHCNLIIFFKIIIYLIWNKFAINACISELFINFYLYVCKVYL